MTQTLHQLANALLYQALEQPVAARPAFLDGACGGDAELHAMVSGLLEPIEQLDAFLDNPLALPDAPGAQEAAVVAEAGAMLGSWRVVRELQRGALGSIMLVERSTGGARQIAALKIVKVDELSLEALARFQRERDKLATLTHPDLARLIDAGSIADGRPFFVMEYSDGLPLDQYCAEWKLAAQQRIALVIRVCMALHHGHQRLVIHGDLQPANVLVDRSGVLKVIDFGIASLLDVRTATDSPFASPESRAGRVQGTSSDIYAVGALLDAVLRAGGEVPHGALADIIRGATAANPDGRHASAHELGRVLQGYLNAQTAELAGLPLAAAPAASVATLAAPAAAMPAAPPVTAPVRPAHVPIAPRAQPKRGKRLTWIVAALAATGLMGAAALYYLPGQLKAPALRPDSASAPLASGAGAPAGGPALSVVAQASKPAGEQTAEQVDDQAGEQALERGDYAQAVTQMRRAVATSDTPQRRFALGRALAAAQDYPAAEDEFMRARAAYSSQADANAMLEVDLARAETFHQRRHGRKAGQTVQGIKPLLSDASAATRARVTLMESLIQPKGTAVRAYAAAQKALPVVLEETGTDPSEPVLQRRSAQAWHKAGEVGLRARQNDSACGYLAAAAGRYRQMESAKRATALDIVARGQVEQLQGACK